MVILAIAIAGVTVFCLAVLFVNTFRYPSKQIQVDTIKPVTVDIESATVRLSRAIQIPTVSHEDPRKIDVNQFRTFHRFLESTYPEVHHTLDRIVINDLSLLYKWQGSEQDMKPILLLAHQDVVPVDTETANKWTHDAFSGVIADGCVWGRGALDDKGSLIAMMEAVERLLGSNFTPRRTILLAFGHDEEIGGQQGASRIADYLMEKNIGVAFALDEGMTILDEDLSPAKRQTAMIGLSEKGYVTLKITARSEGGHSSMPPAKTAIGSLARAIGRLEKHQLPARFSGPAASLFDFVGPEMPFLKKLLFANLWAFKGIVFKQLEKGTATNALIRTTCAPTMINGGIKENILPGQAHGLVNFRILPGDSIESVAAHAKKVIDDPAIDVSLHTGPFESEPSPISTIDSFGFNVIRQTIHQLFEDTLVSPGLVFAATDSRHFASISENIYRFTPYIFGTTTIEQIHGIDERIATENYEKVIQFYVQLIRNSN